MIPFFRPIGEASASPFCFAFFAPGLFIWASARYNVYYQGCTLRPNNKGGLPLNILLVHCHYRLPGGEDAVFAAERAMLERHGHRVFVYERSNEESTGSGASPLAKLLLPLQAIYSFKTRREVRALIRRHQIQLVHVHNTLLVISPSVFGAARAEGVPVVQTLHNFRIFCPSGILMREGRVCEDCPHHSLLCAVRHRCYRDSLAQSLICAAIYGVHRLLGTYRRVNLIALTEFNRQKLLEYNTRHRVFDPARLSVKPDMVQLQTPRTPLPAAERENRVVFAGRLEELKGLRSAIQAWQLLGTGPEVPVLTVCGAGPLEPWARETARGLRVEFLGQVSRSRLYDLLGRARAALVPSLCYEGQCLVPIEAHAQGTPALVSDLGNVGASVTEGEDGLHFVPGEAEDIARAVRALPELWRHCDPAEMQRATLAAYAPEENYEQLMEIYDEIVRGENLA